MYADSLRKRQGTKLVMVLSDERSKEITRIKFIHRKLNMLKRQGEKLAGNSEYI